jgi:hypothetical protein
MSSVTFPPSLGGDGSTVSDDTNPTTGLANGGHRTRFIPALAQTVIMAQTAVDSAQESVDSAAAAAASAASALAAPGTNATSVTPLTVGTGSKSLTIQTGKSIVVGMVLQIARTSAPSTTYMHGVVTAYNSGDGSLVVAVDYALGSGSYSDWTISITAPLDPSRAPSASPTLTGTVTVSGDVVMNGGSIVEAEGAAVASAATTNIWAGDGNTVHVTGTTTITSFGTAPQAGAWMKVIFDGALTLTQGANLNLNGGGGNVIVAAGDMALVYADTTTQMDVFVIRANGRSITTDLLAALTPTAAANVDFLSTFSSTYDDYLVLVKNVTPASNAQLQLRVAVAGVVQTGATDYRYGGNTVNTSAAQVLLNGATTVSASSAGSGQTVNIDFRSVNDTGRAKHALYQTIIDDAVNWRAESSAFAYTVAANAISGFRLMWSGGVNFQAVGKVCVFGIAKS